MLGYIHYEFLGGGIYWHDALWIELVSIPHNPDQLAATPRSDPMTGYGGILGCGFAQQGFDGDQ
ncbi:MAG: hypothetical protein KDF65_16675, partial [Anaerolineae bacterium]|nr:hypothetical protein [Anaerolineae bacterium]